MLGFVPTGSLSQNRAMIDVLGDLGLKTSLQLCLDAGDSRSYDGSSQTWVDQSSGGYSFFRGSTGSGESSDPTFNGNAGRQSGSEYFSYDGGDLFTLSVTTPAWINSMHKDNGLFTIVQWVYANNITSTSQFLGAFTTGTLGVGRIYFGNSAAVALGLQFDCIRSTNVSALTVRSTGTVNNNAWNMIAISFDEAAGNLIFSINGSNESLTGKTYTSPSTTDAGTVTIGQAGSSGFESTGDRVWGFVAWSRALSTTELTSLFTATRQRYGV